MNKLLSACLVASLGPLAACDDEITFNARLTPRVSFDLQASGGARVEVTANRSETWQTKYDVGGKKLTFTDGGQKMVFKNVKFDRNRGVATADASKTGQRTSRGDKVGLTVDFDKVCSPQCERVETFVTTVDCTVPGSGGSCTTYPGGGVYCPPNPGYPGRQQVRVTRTSTDYAATGYLVTGTSQTLADLSGRYTHVEDEYEPIGACQ